PTPDLDSVYAEPPDNQGQAGTPTPDLDAVLADAVPDDVQPVEPASGWLDPKSDPAISQQGPTPEAQPVDESAPPTVGRSSSFDFKLSQGDIDPVKVNADETGVFQSALPPRPVATERPSNVSFDFIDLPSEGGGPGSGVKTGTGLQNVPTNPVPID